VSEADKGKFTTHISQQVIDEALESVEKAHPPPSEESTAAGETPQAPANSDVEELRSQLSMSQEKGRETMARLQDAHERMLRSVADLENYRKRAQKEKEQIQKFGAEKILSDFLPVLDNLDRALEHSNSAADFTSLMQGVSMTRKLFEDTLAKHGVQPIPSVGHPFDPHFHEAIQQAESQDLPPNHVVSELASGYTLNDRLLRPALVIVSSARAQPIGHAEANTSDKTEPSAESAQEQET
jgi:molecular chaperone GrpE